MIDHVNRDGFMYRMAYPFSNKPRNVQICLLPYRALGMGLWRLVLSLVAWFVLGIIFGVMLWVTIGIGGVLLGRKSVYGIDMEDSTTLKSLMGGKLGNLLNRLTFLSYNWAPIESLPTIRGKRILPIYVIAMILIVWIVWTFWYIVPATGSAIISSPPDIWGWIQNAVSMILDWQLWARVFLFAISTTVTILIYYKILKFIKSETWEIFKAFLEAKIKKLCPIVPVI